MQIDNWELEFEDCSLKKFFLSFPDAQSRLFSDYLSDNMQFTICIFQFSISPFGCGLRPCWIPNKLFDSPFVYAGREFFVESNFDAKSGGRQGPKARPIVLVQFTPESRCIFDRLPLLFVAIEQ